MPQIYSAPQDESRKQAPLVQFPKMPRGAPCCFFCCSSAMSDWFFLRAAEEMNRAVRGLRNDKQPAAKTLATVQRPEKVDRESYKSQTRSYRRGATSTKACSPTQGSCTRPAQALPADCCSNWFFAISMLRVHSAVIISF